MPRSTLDLLSTHGPDGRASLLLAGTLDADTAPRLTAEVERLAARDVTSLVVDLADLRAIDLAGVVALLAASSSLGGRVTIRDGRPLIGRLLAV